MTISELKAELSLRTKTAEEDAEQYPDNDYCEGVRDGLNEAIKLVSQVEE